MLPTTLESRPEANPSESTGAPSTALGTSDTPRAGDGHALWQTAIQGRPVHLVDMSESAKAALGDVKPGLRIKTCERCGTDFTCKQSATCWCSKYEAVDIDPETLDCICGGCLRKLAAGPRT